jgi:hypothetical protein
MFRRAEGLSTAVVPGSADATRRAVPNLGGIRIWAGFVSESETKPAQFPIWNARNAVAATAYRGRPPDQKNGPPKARTAL